MPAERTFFSAGGEALVGVVADRTGLERESLKAHFITPDEYGEVWRIEGKSSAYIARLASLEVEDALRLRMFRCGVGLEAKVMHYLREHTKIPVPEVYCYEPCCEELGCSLTLMEFLPGRHLNHAAGKSVLGLSSQGVARAFRELHAIEGDGFGQEGDALGLHNSWGEAFGLFFEKVVLECVDKGCFSRSEADVLMEAYGHVLPMFDLVTKPSLLHGNPYAVNLLFYRDGALSGVIDWVDTLWGDPLWDLYILKRLQLMGVNFYLNYPEAKDILEGEGAAARKRFYYGLLALENVAKSKKVLEADALELLLKQFHD